MSADASNRWKQAITWTVAIVCSGLGGAIFNNWYSNRSTVIEYSINRTVLGTDQTTVVPNFRVQVGNTVVQSLYLYTIKLQYSSGPELENARIGIGLTTPGAKLVGNTVTEKPGEAFEFNCAPFETGSKSSGTTCILRRLSPHVGAYVISFATDTDSKINVSIDAKNALVRHAETGAPEELSNARLLSWLGLTGVGSATLFGVLSALRAVRREGARSKERFYGGELDTDITDIKAGQSRILSAIVPTVTPVNYGMQEDPSRNGHWPGLLIANDGQGVAYEVNVEPFRIGKWDIKFDRVNRLGAGEKTAIWIDIHSANIGDSDLRGHLVEWQSANSTLGDPVEFKITYRDRNHIWFASACQFQMSIKGVDVLFQRLEAYQPPTPAS